MMTRGTRIKLAAFAVIALVSVLYVGGKYAGLDRLFGTRGYAVTAQLTEAAGIHPGAEVAYRGVTIGKVAAVELTDDGVDMTLDISDDAPHVPADTTAIVTNRSAVGEQYVDLRPNGDGEPYLREGSVIERDSTEVPIRPDALLGAVDRLLRSLNTDSVRTVVEESYAAFADAGPELQRLLDSAGAFTKTARANVKDIERLLSTARTVLQTQREHGDDLTRFASGLKRVAKQFADSDGDLRKVIDRAPQVGELTSKLMETSGSDLTVLIANLLTTSEVARPRGDALEQLMVQLPVVGAFPPSVTAEDRGQLGLVFDMFNPPSCTKGYETTDQRPADDLREAEPNKEAYCAEPPGSPISVRGAQNAPYKGKPVQVAPPSPESGEPAEGDRSLPGLLSLPSRLAETSGLGGLLGP